MKAPPTYRLRTAAVLLTALLAWCVPGKSLLAQDEASPAGEGPAVEAPAVPDASDAATAEAGSTESPAAPAPSPAASSSPTTSQAPTPPEPVRLRELVTIMNSAHLRANETTPEMVTVMGDAVIDGEVDGDCVTVLGSVTVNGKVRGNLVCVGGRVILGPDAEIRGEVVSVGGGLHADPSSRIRGEKVIVHFPGFGGFGGWTAEWFSDGLAKARVLPHNHQWAWGAAFVAVLLNVLFAALFSGAVAASARAVESRPVFSCVNGALTLLLAPVLFVLLAVSVIGIPLLPIAAAALFLCWFIGSIGVYAFCGQQLGVVGRPVLAVLVGNLVFLLLYAVPVIGFAVWSVTAMMGLGAAVTAMGNRRREAREARQVAARGNRPPPPAAQIPPAAPASFQPAPSTPVPPAPYAAAPQATTESFAGNPPPMASAGFTGAPVPPESAPAPAATSAGPSVPSHPRWTPPPMPAPAAAAAAGTAMMPPLPADVAGDRATFAPRLFAFVLDLVAVTVAINVLSLGAFPVWVLSMIAYHVFFWGWRGTTPAGIVFNLQIVRDDGAPMDYRIAIVRALSGVFSLVPAGLGFIWAAFDRENQSWHDKLAGTSVVVVRKARPLI